MNAGGTSSHPSPSSDPSTAWARKSKSRFDDTPSKKLSRNLDSLSSSKDGPGAGAVGEGKGKVEEPSNASIAKSVHWVRNTV